MVLFPGFLVALLAGSALVAVVQQLVQPRLPVYKLSIVLFPRRFSHWPRLVQSSDTGEWRTAITTDVELFNANYLHLHVHAVSFDLYAEQLNDQGHCVLRHIGNLQDRQQQPQQHQKKKQGDDDTLEDNYKREANEVANHNNPAADADVPGNGALSQGSSFQNQQQQPLWSIEARSNFTSTTTLYMALQFIPIARSMLRLFYRLWDGSGQMSMTTTGVAHIHATTTTPTKTTSGTTDNVTTTTPSSGGAFSALLKAPLTVSIICNNIVDTWQLTVVGSQCVLHQMIPGWLDLPQAAAQVRNHALQSMAVNATTGSLVLV